MEAQSSGGSTAARSHQDLRAAAIGYMRAHEESFAPFVLPVRQDFQALAESCARICCNTCSMVPRQELQEGSVAFKQQSWLLGALRCHAAAEPSSLRRHSNNAQLALTTRLHAVSAVAGVALALCSFFVSLLDLHTTTTHDTSYTSTVL